MRFKALRLLIMAGLLIGCATDLQARTAIDDRQRQRVLADLTKRTDADSLAAAGLLSLATRRDQALALLARAAATQPARADLVWLEAQSCEQAPSCDPIPIERRLRTLDPNNGAGWLGTLTRADLRNDATGKQAALAAIARSTRVDVYWTRLIAALSPALEHTKAMSLGKAELTVSGFLAAEKLPSYRVVADTCRGEELQNAQVTRTCRGIAKAFEHGDTYLTEILGASIAMRVWPKGSQQWEAANDARRTFEYRSKLVRKLEAHALDGRGARTYLALCAQNHREQDVAKAQLIQAGLRPDPPTADH